jgi:Tfp pilus assembly protein PilP
MMFNMRIWSYMKFFFFLWISVTEAQPLFASTLKSSAQEDLSLSNYQLKALFKLSGIENSLENIESVVEMSGNINKEVLRPGQGELSRRIMIKAYSRKEFYHTLKSSFIENHKPQYLPLAVQWYQSALGKKILRLESAVNDPLNRLAMEALTKKLLGSPPGKARMRLMERIELSAHVTEAAKTLFLEYVRLMYPFNKKVGTKEPYKNLQALKVNITEPIREVVLDRMIFSYRDIKNKDLEKYARFLGSPTGQWFSQAKLKGLKKGIKKASYKAGLIQAGLLKEIDSGGPDYPLLRDMVPLGQRYLLIGRRDPFRPLVNEQGLVGFSRKEKSRPLVRLFGGELKVIPPLSLPVFEKIKDQYAKLYKKLIKFQRLFNDREALEKMEDQEYSKAIKNYSNALKKSSDIKMEVSPLQIEYDAIRMTGVILKRTQAFAMFEVEKTGYAVKKGDLVGPYFGTVKEIKDGQVIVVEKFKDYLGNILKNQKTIHFSRSHKTSASNNL